MFKNINNHKIPLILLNARITKKTFNRWFHIKFFSKNIFNQIKIAYPQNLETKKYLKKLNTKKVLHLGNLKFAQSTDEFYDKISHKLQSEFSKKKFGSHLALMG